MNNQQYSSGKNIDEKVMRELDFDDVMKKAQDKRVTPEKKVKDNGIILQNELD